MILPINVLTHVVYGYTLSQDTPISYFGRQVFAENRRRSRGEEGPAD